MDVGALFGEGVGFRFGDWVGAPLNVDVGVGEPVTAPVPRLPDVVALAIGVGPRVDTTSGTGVAVSVGMGVAAGI